MKKYFKSLLTYDEAELYDEDWNCRNPKQEKELIKWEDRFIKFFTYGAVIGIIYFCLHCLITVNN